MTDFEQRVRERAYFIWEDEGRVFGRADAQWLRAETELRARASVEPMLVQAPPPALTLAASPAKVLKPKRSRAATTKVDAEPAIAKTAITKATKAPVKSPAKAAAKSAEKAATAKVAAPKAEAKASKAPRAVARARAAEVVATVH